MIHNVYSLCKLLASISSSKRGTNISVSETFEPVYITHQPLLISTNITLANGWIFQERNITVSNQGILGNYPNIAGFSWEKPMVFRGPQF